MGNTTLQKTTKTFGAFALLALALALLFGAFGAFSKQTQSELERNKRIVAQKNEAIAKLVSSGRYKCCLNEPCFRCFSKPGAQEKELVCDCMNDIYEGKHPCGECIGEILEGEGNAFMAQYFASAIAEKLGARHLPALKRVISQEYGIAPEEQF